MSERKVLDAKARLGVVRRALAAADSGLKALLVAHGAIVFACIQLVGNEKAVPFAGRAMLVASLSCLAITIAVVGVVLIKLAEVMQPEETQEITNAYGVLLIVGIAMAGTPAVMLCVVATAAFIELSSWTIMPLQ